MLRSIERPNGMIIEKTAIPLGVIAIIYESRPNVTSDAAALCIKSGKRLCASKRQGGVEERQSRGGRHAGRTGRGRSAEDLRFSHRGYHPGQLHGADEGSGICGSSDSAGRRRSHSGVRVDQAKVPCIQTGTGICHVYVDGAADLDKALAIIENAKTAVRASATRRKCVWYTKISPIHFFQC